MITNPLSGLMRSMKKWLGTSVAGSDTDPYRIFNLMAALPNPDAILRQLGHAEVVYRSIAADSHVIGDIRSIRGSFRGHSWRLLPGDEGDSKSLAAMELCKAWMASAAPNEVSDWLEVMWQMTSAIFTGYRPHELVWEYRAHDGPLTSNKYLPTQVIDRPTRRFLFNADSAPLLISRGNMLGAPVEPYQFVISRHMADSTNPYGQALLSSCFHPWTYKTGGWRFFVKYCERHGLPWPVAKFPRGTPDKDLDDLEKYVAQMLEASYLLLPDDNSIELLTPNQTGGGTMLPQQQLIDLCNREMSKALTGQAMVAELQGTGARAASETAQDRQDSIQDSDRDIAASGMGQIFQWITLFNFGAGVAPPYIEFFKHENAGKDRADTYQAAASMGARPSKRAMLEELGIPEAEDDDDALQPLQRQRIAPKPAAPPLDFSRVPGYSFAKAVTLNDDEALQLAIDAADEAIADKMIAPIADMLARYEADGKTLAEFHADLQDLVGVLDDEVLREVIERALTYSLLRGAATEAD